MIKGHKDYSKPVALAIVTVAGLVLWYLLEGGLC
jgi:hypothetical protein